jgi:tetratricopeptide (TPR) repeat protein
MRTGFWIAALLASTICLSAPAADWAPLTREQALEQTKSNQVGKRRLAYGRLAEVGTQEDVPVLLAALWDEEELIRGMAEQAVWGIWMRTDDPVADPMFQTGMQRLVEDDPDEAVAKLNQVIELKPEFAEAWNRRGDAYVMLGEEGKALADYDQALRLNPYHFGVLESCAQIYLDRHEVRKAAAYFQRAIDLNPNLLDAADMLRKLEVLLENDSI